MTLKVRVRTSPVPDEWFGIARAFLLLLGIAALMGIPSGIMLIISHHVALGVLALASGLVSLAVAIPLGVAIRTTYRSRDPG